jgi:hypothetical protein
MVIGRRSIGDIKYPWQGMDEVVHGIGHLLGNILPCCIICNKAKNDYTLEEFCSWYNKRRLPEYYLTPEKIISDANNFGNKIAEIED